MNRRDFNLSLLSAVSVLISKPSRAQSQLRVNGARINSHLAALAEFGKNPQGGVSRVAYSEADRQGREYALGLMRAAKLDVSVDGAGNIVGRRTAAIQTSLRSS